MVSGAEEDTVRATEPEPARVMIERFPAGQGASGA
jgi:hypothetical protein